MQIIIQRVSLLEQFHVGLNFNSEFKFKQCSSQDWFGSHLLCYAASMINLISCDSNSSNSEVQQLTSDAFIEVGLAYWSLQLQQKIYKWPFISQYVFCVSHWCSRLALRSPLHLELFQWKLLNQLGHKS